MKHKSSEWIVVANLMSGVVAVVIAMCAVGLAQTRVAGAALPGEAAKPPKTEAPAPAAASETVQSVRLVEAPREEVASILGEVKSALTQSGAARFVSVDADSGKITLKEGAFRRGSACIEPEAKEAFAKVEGRIADYLTQFQSGRIYVEGHTDNKPVKAPVTDYRAFCTVYDDNFTLSAARAREARSLLIGRAGGEASRRVIVAGYGDSQPLPGVDPGDERNRRVELRFVNGAERAEAR
ncbi:OmpA/MotB family protein [Herbaspirillum robiniae]|uniref:Flagellar motor protein n=1 Tax=Herbaspirillum robiniae TaxID=2014887 RepID=A0A246WQM0_9BURK|nr:OmpA family protein [Herbaspirillum robiniae]NUU02605.1 OmpA family protein [Herbaspirillum robiniae]OWY27896.1 flagellar motor protein [Herbaspirillum robiniae]